MLYNIRYYTRPDTIQHIILYNIRCYTFSIYYTAVDGHEANFQTHITNDMAQYDDVVAKLSSYVQAYQISGHIQDPYYAFMYTDVFGSASVNDIITLLQNGDIT